MSERTDALLTDKAFLAAVASDEPIRPVAQRFGCSFGFVQNLRKKQAAQDDESQRVTWTGTEGTLAVVIHEDMTHENILRKFGHNTDNVRILGTLEETHWQFGTGVFNHRYKFRTQRRDPATGEWPADLEGESGPAWPVIQPAAAVIVTPVPASFTMPRESGLKLAAKCADHQIGFRVLPDGTYDPFHDESAMAVFVEICRIYQPDKIQILGDFIDLPSQSRWAQEASFARTTQKALDTAHRWLAELRAACPNAEIIIIEGNHDKRLQTFMETNALAAFGLHRAEMPQEWPVMSLPHLLRLDDLGVIYIDAYPAATNWDNEDTRNIHGTKANSKGSTTSQYVSELPHINTWAGHTHRPEITYSTVLGKYGAPIESYSANPGCMCRTDGATPSVHGAIGASGIPTPIVENWQNGFGFLYYNETEGWPQVYRIKNGKALLDGKIIAAKSSHYGLVA